jgi:uncharacterized membrane protein YfcA
MIAMVTVFLLFLIVFGCIGAVRGWAKELLIVISVVLGLAAISLVEDLLGFKNTLFRENVTLQYWFRTVMIFIMIFFGYKSPSFPRLQQATEKRGMIQENLLGFVFGVISGFFVVGTLWSFTSQANYPHFSKFIGAVPAELSDITSRVMNILPPVWLSQPTTIFIVVVISFVFAIVALL